MEENQTGKFRKDLDGNELLTPEVYKHLNVSIIKLINGSPTAPEPDAANSFYEWG